MSRLITQIDDAPRKIHGVGDIVPLDEDRVFKDSTLRLTFVRHTYDGDEDKIRYSDVIVIGGNSPALFPLTEVPRYAVTLHQGDEALPNMASDGDANVDTAERIWRDARDKSVLVGRTLSGSFRAVSVGGSEVVFPCACRGTGATLYLGA